MSVFLFCDPGAIVRGTVASGFEDLARYFVTPENKIATRCTAHVMGEIPAEELDKFIYSCYKSCGALLSISRRRDRKRVGGP